MCQIWCRLMNFIGDVAKKSFAKNVPVELVEANIDAEGLHLSVTSMTTSKVFHKWLHCGTITSKTETPFFCHSFSYLRVFRYPAMSIKEANDWI